MKGMKVTLEDQMGVLCDKLDRLTDVTIQLMDMRRQVLAAAGTAHHEHGDFLPIMILDYVSVDDDAEKRVRIGALDKIMESTGKSSVYELTEAERTESIAALTRLRDNVDAPDPTRPVN
jgi:hypothetical protein